ncbi:MAG: DODA-type extradiol aromatic ring-opening family dioxygenase [Thermoleophilia bacterium]
MSVLDEGKGALWRGWAERLPRPLAILVVSAHWEGSPVIVGSTERHDQLLYDFYGFPSEMYGLRYPAPGAPKLAASVRDALADAFPVATSERPVDHGVWIPLLRMWPAADIPVLQVSMPATMSESELYGLGERLAPLRDDGVFILASGNLVHDLRGASFERDEQPPRYVLDFDEWIAGRLLARDDAALIEWSTRAPEPRRCHPTPEHYRPILVAIGAAGGDPSGFPIEGFENRTVSRRCVQFG